MKQQPQNSPPGRCPWCGVPLVLIDVHGHRQCAHCKINVDPCCSGERCDVVIEEGEAEVR